MYRYAVIGAGRQGVALAYDLAMNGEADAVVLADADERASERAARRLKKLLKGASCELIPRRCDASKRASVRAAIAGSHVALSAVPYRLNPDLAAWAVESKCSFLDLGGNTSVVRRELKLHARAARAGVSVVPDCGLAPGLGNHLAAHGVASLDAPEHVHVRCGGLPERPVGPLAYKLVFNFEGLANEYSGFGEFLRDGKMVEIPTLTEIERIDFGPPLGLLEAAVTSGGTSTCPETWRGRLQTYDYKTLRYAGHWATIRALFDLGFFEPRLRTRDRRVVEPRTLTRALFEDRLAFRDVRDVVVLRTTVSGRHRGTPRTLRYDYFERHDEATGFTAMERGTAFPAATVAHLQARGEVAPGARPLEVAVPPLAYFEALPAHGVRVDMSAA